MLEQTAQHPWRLDGSRTKAKARAKKKQRERERERQGQGQRKEEKERKTSKTRQSSRDGVTTAESGGHKAANCWHWKEKQVHQIQSGAVEATASSSSSQITVKKTGDGAKELAFVEKVERVGR